MLPKDDFVIRSLRALKVIDSCKTYEQLNVATKYCGFVVRAMIRKSPLSPVPNTIRRTLKLAVDDKFGKLVESLTDKRKLYN